MKVSNHDNKGNPYHNDSNGEFTSADENGTNVDNGEKDVLPNQLTIKGLNTASFNLSGLNLSGKSAINEILNSKKTNHNFKENL